MNKLFMMVGLQASGKSHQSKIFAERYNAEIFSSDAYRAIYGSGEEDQSINQIVFEHLEKDIFNALAEGRNVIYDATNTSSKRRRAFLEKFKKLNVEKICVLVLRSYENCLIANNNRERKVPVKDIKKLYMSFQTPYIEEGWDKIELIYTDNDSTRLGEPFQFAKKYKNYDQNNYHHSQTLGEHLSSAYCYIVDNYGKDKYFKELSYAAIMHDMAKPFCRTCVNKRGIVDDYSHYYGHDSVGSYDVLFIDTDTADKLLISFLISYHMRPLNWVSSEKAKRRDRMNWGEEKFDLICKLNKADVESH